MKHKENEPKNNIFILLIQLTGKEIKVHSKNYIENNSYENEQSLRKILSSFE